MNTEKMAKEELEMDMTPMIDCVFLLMIFFVLVIDLSQKNLEDLILPMATFQTPDDQPPENRPILNVMQNGAVYFEGEMYYDPQATDPAKRKVSNIQKLLQLIHDEGLRKGTLTEEELPGLSAPVLADPILIRADKWTEWHYVGEIMKQCSQPDIAFWKVQLALSEQDKETGEKNASLTKGQ